MKSSESIGPIVQEIEEAKDFEYDEVRGEHGRKPKMAILNKTKLSKYEMDDLFLGDEPKETASDEY
jgi:hypothetical protein